MCGHIIRLDLGRRVTTEIEREVATLHALVREAVEDGKPRTREERLEEYRRYLRGEIPDPRD